MINRVSGLDGLRALACLMVLAHHILPRLPQSGSLLSDAIQTFGVMAQAGVSIFFVLSGFLLALPFWRAASESREMPSLKQFLSKRFARIVPGFYLALLVSFVLSVTLFDTPLSFQTELRLFSGLLFLSSFHPVTLFPVDLNGPLWSIGFEVGSYMLLFLALVLALRLYKQPTMAQLFRLFTVTFVASIVMHQVWVVLVGKPTENVGWDYGLIGYARTWMPYTNIFALFCHFMVGVFAAGFSTVVQRRWRKSLKMDALFVMVSALLVGLLGLEFLILEDGFSGVLHLLYMWPVFPTLIGLTLIFLPFTHLCSRLLDTKPLRYLAEISFGIYVWHMIYVELVSRLWMTDYVYNGGMTIGNWLFASTVVVLLTVMTAHVSWFQFERPILNRVRRAHRANDASLSK